MYTDYSFPCYNFTTLLLRLIIEQTIELSKVIQLADDQISIATGTSTTRNVGRVNVPEDEFKALRVELNVLRTNALERDTSLSKVVERNLQTENKLRTIIRESVDALEMEQEKNTKARDDYHSKIKELRK